MYNFHTSRILVVELPSCSQEIDLETRPCIFGGGERVRVDWFSKELSEEIMKDEHTLPLSQMNMHLVLLRGFLVRG